MSEKRAKKLRKEQPQETARAMKKSGAGFNVILALIIVAAIALGGYVIYNQYKINNPSTDPETVADRAKTEEITVEEFLAKYGLEANEEVKADTELAVASGYMTVEKYAELEGMTVDELRAEFGIVDEAGNDMTMNEAQSYVPISKVLEMAGMDYESFLQMYGLTAEQVPQDMLYKDAEPIIQAAQESMMAQSEADAEAAE